MDVREENNELKQIWEIGKHMWNRQYADVYQAIQTFSWPQPLGGLVQILKGSVYLELIASGLVLTIRKNPTKIVHIR